MAAGAALLVIHAASAGPAGAEREHVLLICIDVLRADHMGVYGYARDTTPRIDDLARSSVVFEHAVSPGCWTKTSVPSYMTGRFPHQHGVYRQGSGVSDLLPDEELTLAESFHSAGYETAAFVKNFILREELGLSQGFDLYRLFAKSSTAADIQESFVDWLDQRRDDAPFFCYLHFLDPHLPYDPPEETRAAFGPTPSRFDFGSKDFKSLKRYIRDGTLELTDSDRQAMMDLYDAEVLFTDKHVGLAVDALESRGLLDETMIVLLSDHGEEFLERGGIGHGSSLYEELIHVPLIMRFPGARHGGTGVNDPVSLVDVFPTLARYFGLAIPSNLAGSNLLPSVAGDASPAVERPIYAEGLHGSRYQQAVRMGALKYVVSVPSFSEQRTANQSTARHLLREGLRVEVEAIPGEGGDMLALEVEIRTNQKDERHKIKGPIERIDREAGRIVVAGYEVRSDPAVELDGLEVGSMVKLSGRATGGGQFLARRLRPLSSKRAKIELQGPIASPVGKDGAGSHFLLAGRRVRFDSKTEVVRQGEAPAAGHGRLVPVAPLHGDLWLAALERGVEPVEELYRLDLDPGERHNLGAEQPDELERMRAILLEVRGRGARGDVAGDPR